MSDSIPKNPQTTFVEQMFGSSVMTACNRCGSTATYRGSPDKINAAAKEFYELHERCYQRNKQEPKR